jgi:parallel beta-helix repeat protein
MSRYDHLLIVAVVAVFSSAHADTIYVDDDNCPGPGDGSDGNPYCSIQTAIDNAVDTDEIVVAPGTYFETIDFDGKAIWLHSSDGADVTIIDASGLGYVSVVTCDSGEGPGTVLEGFTLTGGTGTVLGTCPAPSWGYKLAGGGMLVIGSSPTVVACTFSANRATSGCTYSFPPNYYPSGNGGGMYNDDGSNPTVIDCTFAGNTANLRGAGMYNSDGSNPTVTDCTFIENVAVQGGEGGGMYNFVSSPTVTNCTFSGNDGGGMYNYGSASPTVTDCTFSGNDGGGMFNRLNSNPTVTDCSFTDNVAVTGGGMYNYDSSPTVTNCTFTMNWAFSGGGMSNRNDSSPTVTDCTFSGNIAECYFTWSCGYGGGMRNWDGSNPEVADCKFTDNWAEDGGGGMYNGGGSDSSPTVTDCRFERNTTDFDYGGGIMTESGSPLITDSRFCENTPDHIWGPWDGDDNTFWMFCRVFGFDKIDVEEDDILSLLDR